MSIVVLPPTSILFHVTLAAFCFDKINCYRIRQEVSHLALPVLGSLTLASCALLNATVESSCSFNEGEVCYMPTTIGLVIISS